MAETNEIDQSERSTLIESHPKKKKRKRNKIKYPSSQLYKYFRSGNNLKNYSLLFFDFFLNF